MIGFLDNTGLYCRYQDQIHALESGSETGFCTFTGIVQATFNCACNPSLVYHLVKLLAYKYQFQD